MASAWQAPDDWQKDGSIISGVSSLKTGAWTSMLSAKETRQGKEIDIVIKTFCVPQDIVQDPDRITRERDKFLTSARLQKQLTDAHAAAWIPVLRISDHADNTSFSMERCAGASLQDMLERKVHLSATDLFQITLAILQGFDELFQLAKRSHGSLKPSDVLNAPGHNPPYLMADPSPKGDSHSANDLYSLGQILFQLIEHREWDPLAPIIPTSQWARFGPKRDRWIQFLNMLLAPNGCQEPLANVRKEALRLKPATPARNAALAAASLLVLAGAGAVIWHYLPGLKSTPSGGGGAVASNGPQIDPQLKADWDKAHDSYLDLSKTWTDRERTDRYDHAKSTDLFRASRAFIIDAPLTNAAAFEKSRDAYNKAVAKLQEALAAYADENKTGQRFNDDALADFQKAQEEFAQAKAAWDAAAARFMPAHDHTRSTAVAQATPTPPANAPADAASRHDAAEQNRAAAARYTQAIALAKEEELVGLTVEQAKTNFADAQTKYQQVSDRFDAASVGLDFDFSAAKTLATQARAAIPGQLVLTDAASYQKYADLFQTSAGKLDQALTALDQAKRDHNAQEGDSATSLARAVEALNKKDYAAALSWYRKAADLGNSVAMFNVGLFYETGRGTEKNETEAARWYQRAADQNQTSAMVNLGLLYERGAGVQRNIATALNLYKKAADLNDVNAMRNIAYLYDNGIGVEKSPAEALVWYRKAADQKDPSSLFLIGVFYEQGKSVPIDYAQAITWYTKAADLQYPRAMNALGVLHETGRGVKPDPVQAMAWYKKAADLNFGPAMSNIGALYDNGVGVPLDHAEAFKWFRKGADLGHPMSMYNLAVLYETGRGTAADLNQALDWYRKAAHSDDAQAAKQATDRLKALGFPV